MDQVSQIKQNLNITDIVGNYVELKKAGRNYKGVCPFHAEKTPSFMVSADLQIYKCFGCGESGDVFSFIQKVEGIDFVSALEQLAEKAGIKLEKKNFDPHIKQKKTIYKINGDAAEFYHFLLMRHKAGNLGKEYLQKKRGLKNDTIKDFKLGVAPAGWDILVRYLTKKGYSPEELELAGVAIKSRKGNYIDKFRNRIIFPLVGIDEKVVGFIGRTLGEDSPKYLNTAETIVFHKGSFIFGLNKAKIDIKKQGAVFVEGQMDVITAHQAGIKNVIASTGTALTPNQLKILSRYTNDLIFCFDSDTAGQTATMRAIEIAEKQDFNIKVAAIPEGFGDLDELVKTKPDTAKKLIEETSSIYDFFILSALRKFDKNTAYGKKKIMEDLSTKLSKINSAVVKEHYTKHLAHVLSLETETVKEYIQDGKKIEEKAFEAKAVSANALNKEDKLTEEYILTLLFNAKLELAQNILYKLGQKDFTKEQNRDIFVQFKEYIRPRKRQFKAKHFIKKLEGELMEKAQELYLWDIEEVQNNEIVLEKEINTTFKRLKRDTINRELNILQTELRSAELENDKELLTELAKKVYKISKLKKKYE